MNSLFRTLQNVASNLAAPNNFIRNEFTSFIIKRFNNSLQRMHRLNMMRLENPVGKPKKSVLDGKPFAKGVILKTVIRKPRKPNSANRKCVVVKLSTGKEMTAYVPGEGHNLQEHQVVLCKVARLKDVPGVKLKCIRGKYDLGHVVKKNN